MTEHNESILAKIRSYAVQTRQFIGDMDFLEFSNDDKTMVACIFNLSQIGELVSKLESEFIENSAHIPWRKMKGMRNKIVHDYEGIQLNIIWDVIVNFLPELIDNIDTMIGNNKV